MTWIGTILSSAVPRTPTPQQQVARVGPYQVSLLVDPNPPLITQPATLSIQIVSRDSLQPVTNARVTLENTMETMDMTDQASAQKQDNGVYVVHAQLSMSGPWKVLIHIAVPGTQTQSVSFEVTAQ